MRISARVSSCSALYYVSVVTYTGLNILLVLLRLSGIKVRVNFIHLFLGCYFRTDGPTGKHDKAVWRIFKGFLYFFFFCRKIR